MAVWIGLRWRFHRPGQAGLNSTGDSDLKTYYDGIRNLQIRMLKTGALKIYQCCAASIGVQLPADFDLSFKSLWQMTEPEKAQVAAQDSATVVAVWQAGLIKAAVALMELKQLSRLTGRFTNITDEDIAAARDAPPAAPGEAVRDQLSAAWDAVWKPEDHPRGHHGWFIEKTGALAQIPTSNVATPPSPHTPSYSGNFWQYIFPSARAQTVPVEPVEPEEIREEYRPPENFQPAINRPYYVNYGISEFNRMAQGRYNIAVRSLHEIEPNNPLLTQPILTNIRQPGSVPSHETSERIEEEVTAARARAALRQFGGGGPNWTQTRPDPGFEAWARGVLAKMQPAPGQGVVGPEGPEILSLPVFRGVEIIDRNGSPIGEFDRIEGNTFIEEKSAQGIYTLNPRTGAPYQTPDQWAQRQIFDKTSVRIDNLALAAAARPTAGGTPDVPRLENIQQYTSLEFRIQNTNQEVQNAVEKQLVALRSKYPSWTFSATYGD